MTARNLLAMVGCMIALGAGTAHAECFGEYPYRVCSETYVDSQGNVRVETHDSLGNTYSSRTDSYTTPDGTDVVTSSDSMGNTYTLRSWSDSTGVHTVDSMGNRCTITYAGEMIGCN